MGLNFFGLARKITPHLHNFLHQLASIIAIASIGYSRRQKSLVFRWKIIWNQTQSDRLVLAIALHAVTI